MMADRNSPRSFREIEGTRESAIRTFGHDAPEAITKDMGYGYSPAMCQEHHQERQELRALQERRIAKAWSCGDYADIINCCGLWKDDNWAESLEEGECCGGKMPERGTKGAWPTECPTMDQVRAEFGGKHYPPAMYPTSKHLPRIQADLKQAIDGQGGPIGHYLYSVHERRNRAISFELDANDLDGIAYDIPIGDRPPSLAEVEALIRRAKGEGAPMYRPSQRKC